MKKITITDVAEAAGVSIASVSRYIRDPESINPEAAVEVARAIKKLNYVPSQFAQNLKRGHSQTIGVIVPDLTPYFSRACTALNQFFFDNKYLLIICDTAYDPEKELFYLRSLVQQRVGGLIISSCGKNDEVLKNEIEKFTNIVLFDEDTKSMRYDSVGEDSTQSAYRLTKSVLEGKQYDKAALLFNATQYINNERRVHSAQKAVKELKIPQDKITCLEDLTTPDSIYQAVKGFIKEKGDKKVIISYNPIITENVTMVLNALNVKIGEDIDLAGFTLPDYQSKYRYKIPQIVQRPNDMGLKTGEVMLNKMEKPSSKKEPQLHLLLNEMIY